MSTGHGVIPQGEALRRAVAWIAEQGCHDPATVEAACQRFDLGPRDQAFLLRHFAHGQEGAWDVCSKPPP